MNDKTAATRLLDDSNVMRIFDAFNDREIEARLVGGCVRDALIGSKISDIDFAVNAPLEKVIFALQQGRCTVIPTGIAHGTVTAVTNGQAFEITTLRRDIRTNGRHAKIASTSNWREDAARRDFTINALYLDQHGHLFDFFDGGHDLRNGVVRFIGDPRQRIREDFLRILRYYRFAMRFGKGIDQQSLEATVEMRYGLILLSKERKQAELFKILASPSPTEIIKLMNTNKILYTIFEEDADLSIWGDIVKMTNFPHKDPAFAVLIRLFCLFPQDTDFFKNSLRLSNKQLATLKTWYTVRDLTLSAESIFRINSLWGKEAAIVFLLMKCVGRKNPTGIYKKFRRQICERPPLFPLRGEDIIARGVCQGKQVGALWAKCKDWWLDGLGKATKEECLAFLDKML
ncbi:MAG: CCA tRNA nucleotidyltransferase [Holosporales bacterium]|jgi:tRNA nucleotidyltransferase/poly(A) polymerase|nr:CCA tRNA nucleotidyltransferase [Holosporales bacterium]